MLTADEVYLIAYDVYGSYFSNLDDVLCAWEEHMHDRIYCETYESFDDAYNAMKKYARMDYGEKYNVVL